MPKIEIINELVNSDGGVDVESLHLLTDLEGAPINIAAQLMLPSGALVDLIVEANELAATSGR